jgi:hypothetical protein
MCRMDYFVAEEYSGRAVRIRSTLSSDLWIQLVSLLELQDGMKSKVNQTWFTKRRYPILLNGGF